MRWGPQDSDLGEDTSLSLCQQGGLWGVAHFIPGVRLIGELQGGQTPSCPQPGLFRASCTQAHVDTGSGTPRGGRLQFLEGTPAWHGPVLLGLNCLAGQLGGSFLALDSCQR